MRDITREARRTRRLPTTSLSALRGDFEYFDLKVKIVHLMLMQTTFLSDTLRLFNSSSRDPVNHFKLVNNNEVRLCCCHPHFITCTADDKCIHVRGNGPERIRNLSFAHDSVESLQALLEFLQERREDGGDLVDWELEDWVGAGNPCQLRGDQRNRADWGLGLGVDDLWCVDLYPSVEARL